MRPSLFAVAALALTPAAACAEFVMQQGAPLVETSVQPLNPSVERARLARANWFRTHRSPVTSASTGQTHAGIADGFGKGVPLKIALLQILPPALTAQFSQGVDAEQTVDWSGGKPWQAVLRDVVQPLHLRATVGAGRVRIDPAQD